MVIVSLCLIALVATTILWGLYEMTLQAIPDLGVIANKTLHDSQGNVVVRKGDSILKFPATADNKLLYPTPLSDPFLTGPALIEWAVDAISHSYTFNFINFESIINNASIYYTKAGYQTYRRTLIETNIANSVDRKKYVISATPTNAPIVLKENVTPEGVYSWQVQFPIQMVYQNVKETQKLEWMMTMLILRVPLTESPSGVAIGALIVREGKF